MILLDYPYVSDFLLDTISKFGLPVVATKNAVEIAGGAKVNWISEQDALTILEKNPDHPVYTNSENSILWIADYLPTSKLLDIVRVFKNKYEFRVLVKEAYPDLFFQAVALEDLDRIDTSSLMFPLIIKPAVGFFSLGIQRVDHVDHWATALSNLNSEIKRFQNQFPSAVVDSSLILLEAYIDGEEYAFDCYFDARGNPIVLNILHHPFSSIDDVSDRLYSTSPAIITQMHQPILDFLEMLGSRLTLRNFPLHIEIRKKDGKIYPIEVNPLRFGGFCTTADLTWYAYGVNSYLSFLKGLQPAWEHILPSRTDKLYSLILLDNPEKIEPEALEYFDYDGLMRDFEKPLCLRKVPFDQFRFFGFLFTETKIQNRQEIEAILHSDLRKYTRLRDLRVSWSS